MTTTPNKTELNKAVVAVMNGIHRLKKADDNKHGGYKYVSVDDFKDLVRPLLAENGLSIRMTETDYSIETLQGKNGATLSARITYEISIRHISGVEDEPERTTIMLPHTGAQTAGAAKSYALKEYLKGRFLVSTGDKDMIEGGADADSFKPQEYTATAPAARAYDRNPIVEEAYKAMDIWLNNIGNTGTMEDLADFWKENQKTIKALPADWLKELTAKKDEVKATLLNKVAA